MTFNRGSCNTGGRGTSYSVALSATVVVYCDLLWYIDICWLGVRIICYHHWSLCHFLHFVIFLFASLFFCLRLFIFYLSVSVPFHGNVVFYTSVSQTVFALHDLFGRSW